MLLAEVMVALNRMRAASGWECMSATIICVLPLAEREEHELRGPPSTWLGHIADEGGERASDTGLVQPP